MAKKTNCQLQKELANLQADYRGLEDNLKSTVEALAAAEAELSKLKATKAETPDRAKACFERAARALEGLGIQDPTWGPLCYAERTNAGFRMWIRTREYRDNSLGARVFLAQVAETLQKHGRVTGFSRDGYLWWRPRAPNEMPTSEG